MKKYEWVLFDADETLFRFDDFRGLQLMFTQYSVDFTHEDYLKYKTINKTLWVEYQNGNINAQQLQHQRFSDWATKLNISTHDLSNAFFNAMLELCAPLEGAISLLDTLQGKTKLGIITNGFTSLQEARLERTGLKKYFDLLVISEQVNIAKPHRGIFDHALALMGHPSRENVLMVGDTLESDILGGINAELDTCWLNPENKIAPETIKPLYQVSSLIGLKELLESKFL